MKQKCLGFTLVETVMALGIVSGGLLILLGVLLVWWTSRVCNPLTALAV